MQGPVLCRPFWLKEGPSASLGNDYLRTANAQNALCLECHAISTHKGVNCAICHGTHGTGNLYDVRGRLGTPQGYADVTFKSITAMGGAAGW